MSIEQWVILALVMLLPLLEGAARLRRTRTSRSQNGERGNPVTEAPTSRRSSSLRNRDAHDRVMRAAEQMAVPLPPLPPLLPQPASDPDVSRSRLPASHASSSKKSGSSEAQRRVGRTLRGDAVVQWLRPVRNLRSAVVLATILGPPSR